MTPNVETRIEETQISELVQIQETQIEETRIWAPIGVHCVVHDVRYSADLERVYPCRQNLTVELHEPAPVAQQHLCWAFQRAASY